MLNTVLFDMGGTLEDIWYNEETTADVMKKLQAVLRANGLEPGCTDQEFRERVLAGVKEYKRWSEGNMLEAKPEEIWPNYYLKSFHFDPEKLLPITEELANLWEITYYHRELRPGVKEMLDGLKARGWPVMAEYSNIKNGFADIAIPGLSEGPGLSHRRHLQQRLPL